ncbi:unnamed protein product [Brassicogethes aeneus]|uniref:RanBP2-type domain-containing protein n=1 Tax=Brassicogethes aeneus TaxID=1431903 RepID=A0A9P0BHM6_BRAAE|nr:unnamed protein product [Brassicogethes aeneus]
MFAGGSQQRRSSNVRAMQLFHELKQQHPTVPDHIVTACITSCAGNVAQLRETLLAAAAQDLMGRSQTPSANAPLAEMNVSDVDGDLNRNLVNSVRYSKDNDAVRVISEPVHKVNNSTFYAKRPDTLGIKPQIATNFDDNKLQLSEKCKDVHKLLNQVVDKPPRSPLTSKRPPITSPDANRRLHIQDVKKETVSTPTQTTDTLLGGVNLSLNVNCSMDLVQTPTKPKCTSTLQLTPTQPWLQDPLSPRSYTSVNLTLRPPSAEFQPPIDITSRNSSLTYSTSSFDSQRGLQSRLQITVGPGGGSVSSVRARPRSSYHPQDRVHDLLPARAGSLNSLVDNDKPPVIMQQQARIERLRIELTTDKSKLVIKQREYAEMKRKKDEKERTNEEFKKQLEREIAHLKYQCQEFQNNTYHQGQQQQQQQQQQRIQRPLNVQQLQQAPEWSCSVCTFLNHPDLNKCETCGMLRTTYHGRPELSADTNIDELLESLGVENRSSGVLRRLSDRNDLDRSVPLQHSSSSPSNIRYGNDAIVVTALDTRDVLGGNFRRQGSLGSRDGNGNVRAPRGRLGRQNELR